MASLEFDDVSKTYGTGVWAVRNLTLAVDHEEFVVLVGPSGCGKTTALRMLAGLEEITAGEIRIGGARVNDVSPRDRDIAMVFQNYALYPHMSVLRQHRLRAPRSAACRKAERRARVEEAARMLGLDGRSSSASRASSRAASASASRWAARSCASREAFLMDEPLSNLDAKLARPDAHRDRSAAARLGVTTIYVTHDQVEAMTMGDRVAVMRDGRAPAVRHAAQALRRPGEHRSSPASSAARR